MQFVLLIYNDNSLLHALPAGEPQMLGGFNLIEARDMGEAVEIAVAFPCARTGCVEIR